MFICLLFPHDPVCMQQHGDYYQNNSAQLLNLQTDMNINLNFKHVHLFEKT